jgi:putative ABC transport system permease protein
MEQVHDEVLANDRFTVILFASFAVVGLLLAAVGIHGVTAFSVAQRSHEIACGWRWAPPAIASLLW